MNILFVTDNEISPIQGGTERITHTLAIELIKRGHTCYSLYLYPIRQDFPKSEFSGKLQIDTHNFFTDIPVFFSQYHITHIIVNLVQYKSKKTLCEVLYKTAHSKGIKVIACYHAMPGEDFIGANLQNAFYKLLHHYEAKQAIKEIALKLLPSIIWRQRAKKKYRLMPENCDKFILLSPHFYAPYANFAQVPVANNWDFMPNALSFDEYLPIEKLKQKKKEVLIIARLDETSKRLSMALKIWHEIEKDKELSDWQLNIVGGGKDAGYYKSLCQKMKLSRCHLLGRQPEILTYYESASIFMMTSAYEGFGITLTEAQQMGVVPIAFNSYESLQDIITHKESGVIVPNNDIKSYIKELSELMKNDSYRIRLAQNGLESCKQFSKEKITERWIRLLEETRLKE